MADDASAGGPAEGGVESFACADRPLPATVTLLEWCPVVDLLAMVCSDESLVLYRYMKWQRVWSVHYDKPVVTLAWKPDDGACPIIITPRTSSPSLFSRRSEFNGSTALSPALWC